MKKAQRVLSTPWGKIEPAVEMFPIWYLFVVYGFIYILPYGRDIIGTSWFDWCRSEDGPLEWGQFICFSLAFFFSLTSLIKKKPTIKYEWIGWISLTVILFFVAGEEISWGERITGIGFDSIRAINIQGESNIHNIGFFHHKLLDPAFEISCIFLGWLGWRKWPNLSFFPNKKYSLYFLLVALFYVYFDISYASTISQIRNDQEIFELLMALGLMRHCHEQAFKVNPRFMS